MNWNKIKLIFWTIIDIIVLSSLVKQTFLFVIKDVMPRKYMIIILFIYVIITLTELSISRILEYKDEEKYKRF